MGLAATGSGSVLKLAQSAGYIAGALRVVTGIEAEFIPPSQWKGQRTKQQVAEIVHQQLGIDCKRRTSHEIDAIGIGLHLLDRLKYVSIRGDSEEDE